MVDINTSQDYDRQSFDDLVAEEAQKLSPLALGFGGSSASTILGQMYRPSPANALHGLAAAFAGAPSNALGGLLSAHRHRDFLLTRDYTGLAFLFVIFYGIAGFFTVPSTKVALIYLSFLLVQYLVVRQAASRYGIRMVTTVLARVTHKPRGQAPRAA
jgi:hypothetical protein